MYVGLMWVLEMNLLLILLLGDNECSLILFNEHIRVWCLLHNYGASCSYSSVHCIYSIYEPKEVTMTKSDLIQRVNTLLVTLRSSTDTIISMVFTSKCTHFYGTQTSRTMPLETFKDQGVDVLGGYSNYYMRPTKDIFLL